MILNKKHIDQHNKPRMIPFVAYCILITLFSSCANDKSKPVIEHQDWNNDKAEQVTFIYGTNGVTKARMTTQQFIQNSSNIPPFIDMLEGVKVEFFDADLHVENTLTAHTARYYTESENVIIKDSVHVINKKGEQLFTEELIWNQKIERFYTELPVIIVVEADTMFGTGLEANQDFSWWRILNQRGRMPVEKGEFSE